MAVEETIKTSQALIGLQTALTTTVTNAEDLYKIVSDAIAAFDTLADLGIDTIVEKVIEGVWLTKCIAHYVYCAPGVFRKCIVQRVFCSE